MKRWAPRVVAFVGLALIAAVVASILVSGDDAPRQFPTATRTVTVGIPAPERTVTVIEQVNPPITPPKGLGAAALPVVGTITTKGPWAGYTVWFAKWPSSPTAVAYKLWIDGKLTGTQAATPGDTQGITFAVRCGVKHTLNVQIQNAAGAVGPKRASAVTWTPKGCP